MEDYWKKCSTCKKPIGYERDHYICSVSTCQHKRKGFQFCSVTCWDAHLGFANHREAYAEEAKSPSREQFAAMQDVESSKPKAVAQPKDDRAPRRIIVDSGPSSSASAVDPSNIKTDTLVVVSKVKALIKEQADFNTSKCCIDALTKKVIAECLKGIEKAKEAERKTVMGRDIV